VLRRIKVAEDSWDWLENLDWPEIIGIGVAALAAIGVIAWLAKEFFLDVTTTDKLIPEVANKFNGNQVLVLGPSAAGKTALLWYMEKGKPSTEGRGPEKTLGAIILDKKFVLNKDKLAKIAKDMSGDVPSLWAAAMREFKPSGIIYMINPTALPGGLTRTTDYTSTIEREITAVFPKVFDVYESNKIPLKAFHVFLNFSDEWASSAPGISKKLIRFTEDALSDRLQSKPMFSNTKIKVSMTQLAPDRTAWPEVRNALDHFGADLGTATA
jgi:hypothetical protein